MTFGFFSGILDFFGTGARDAKVMARVAEEQRQRLAEMAADPVRRRYVERIVRGEHWSDADIAFNEDANATNVCEHLYPIERLMRITKFDLRYVYPLRISANCLVDQDGFDLAVRPPECVAYLEPHFMERSHLDPRSAMIMCRTCNSIIDVVHRDSANPDTPTFPR